ncbi:PREDICTED: testis-specific Y-encoded-like protein 5 [Chinchilla lanigera]|uniref:testis-specific Y-encoded-like protein 5 n=1 Tax=Chinchilla lanigera TaxID=34839 RepID=UPI00038EFD7E|nr:PREDICTED: testis-specific Y-encoded-like protein 5 [Chinchilla lanigera]
MLGPRRTMTSPLRSRDVGGRCADSRSIARELTAAAARAERGFGAESAAAMNGHRRARKSSRAKGRGKGRAQARVHAAPDGAPPAAVEGNMESLRMVQQKLETLSAQAGRAYLKLSRKVGQLRSPRLESRSGLLENIPGFWGQAFRNHPQLSAFLSSREKEVLSFLNGLEVEELHRARLGYKIKFYFGPNPYFQNKVLIKEYGCGPFTGVISLSTPIQWLPGHDLDSMSQGNVEKNRSFFGWFVSHSSIVSDKIVEIINEELWPNPLRYYLLSEGARGEKAKESGPGLAQEGRPDPANEGRPGPAQEGRPNPANKDRPGPAQEGRPSPANQPVETPTSTMKPSN